MMPQPASLRPFVLLLVALGACSPSARMDATDDMSNGATAPNGTLGGDCSACFNAACGWQQTECAGDPACAQWLTSVQGCPPDSLGHPDPECLRSALPSDGSGRPDAAALIDCMARAPSCCAGADAQSSGGAEGQGGTSASPGDYGPDAGAATNGGTGDAGLCDGCTCVDCLLAIKHGLANDPSCADSVLACYDTNTTPGCWEFGTSYATCAVAANGGSPALCYEQLYSSAPSSAGLAAFATSVLPCAAQYCPYQCFPPAEGACVACQAANCLDPLTAFFAEPDAQLFRWCRQACQGDTSCVQGCAAEHPNGLQVFQVLAQCTSVSCVADCAGL